MKEEVKEVVLFLIKMVCFVVMWLYLMGVVWGKERGKEKERGVKEREERKDMVKGGM